MLILVSGSTRTVRDLAGEHRDRLGILLTPNNWNTVSSVLSTNLPWAIDNGAYSGFNPESFRRLVGRAAGQLRLLWVVCPDIVADARGTLELFDVWEPELRAARVPIALVGQDGQESLPVPWDRFDCLFLGGTTQWKLSDHARQLAWEAKQRGKWVHMGRVNSLRRLRIARAFGCDSVDGSGYSRFAAVARSKGRTDMLLERHLRFVAEQDAPGLLDCFTSPVGPSMLPPPSAGD